MNVLYISSKPAYPKTDGGTFAVASFIDTLIGANCNITYLTISTEKHPFNKTSFPEQVIEKMSIDSCFVDTSVRPLKALIHLFKKGSFNVDRFYSDEMRAKIVLLLNNQSFDTVILDSLFSTPYLSAIRSHFDGKIFVRTHNVEGDLWSYYAESASGLKSLYLKKLASDLQRYEVETLQQCDGILSISDADKDRFKELGITTASETLPVGILNQAGPMDYANNTVYHFGSMNWEPNRESVEQLLSIWDRVLHAVPQAKCVIAGSDSDKYYTSNSTKNIEVLGFVDDPVEFSQKMGILVAPIRTASGIRIKILEAMNAGIPIITTTVGALGIDHATTNCLLIADTPDLLVEKTVALIKSEELRKEIGTNGRDYLNKNHNIADTSQKLIEFISAAQ